jgi:hypothetical protein
VRTARSGQSTLLLLDAAEVLKVEGIDYAVVGAIAGSIHGIVRATLDADAVVSLGVQRAADLERAFSAAGFDTELRHGDADDPIAAVLRVSDPFNNRVDLLIGLRGLEPAAFLRATEVRFRGMPLRVIGLEDYIAMKAYAGGAQDLLDAKSALEASGSTLDLALLKRLAERFGRDASAALQTLLAHRRASEHP